MSYESHLEKIKEAKEDNKLVFFIGSGMSKDVGLPSWSDLIDELKQELNSKENDFLKIAQLYFLEFGEYEYIKKVKSFFPSEKVNPQNFHKYLIKIPQYIITTNWDTVIEKTIDDEMALYDIVRKDEDLTNTSSIKKLIKMHGDIEIGNIVFKEDDYLEYSQKFPLIENYVKSILSTNTVVFLGYSYNDINLKYITKWIQNSSKVRPPAYMIAYEEDKMQEKYFKSHGISVLNISDKYKFKNRSLKIENFLKDISKIDNIFANVNTEIQLIDAFYRLFQRFNNFDTILIDQLNKILKDNIDCKINYDNSGRAIIYLKKYYVLIDKISKKYLKFYKKISKQKFRKRFKRNSKNMNCLENLNKLKFILRTLNKCGIEGIGVAKDKYYCYKQKIYSLKNYSFDIDIFSHVNKQNAYLLLHNNEAEKAYLMYKELVVSNRKIKNYIEMFFAMYNANIALLILKHTIFTENNPYLDDQRYDINQKFSELKQSIREELEPLLFMVRDESFLYKYMYDVKIFDENREKQVKTILNGGFSFSNNETEARQKHKNLLYFVNNNYLCVDIYEDFRNLQIEYIKSTITRQFRNEYKTLEKFELYSCIKYIETKRLKDVFDTFLDKKSNDFKKFRLDNNETEYLIYLLNSLTSMLENISDIYQVQEFETYWINTLYLISLSNYQDIKTIVEIFTKVLKIRSSINIYKETNLFLRIQKYIFELNINNQMLFSLLEIVINKIISSNYNGWDLHLLENNTLLNYLLDEKEENKYSNLELINSLLKCLKNFDYKTQVNISKYFLLNIYDVSDEGIQNSIKAFLMDLNFDSIDIVDILEFKLLLISRDLITFNDFDFEEKINKFIEPYLDGKSFSSALYQVNNLLEYLVTKKEIGQLKEIQEKIFQIINEHESLKLW